jgi:hypothetical protein
VIIRSTPGMPSRHSLDVSVTDLGMTVQGLEP